MRTLIFLATVAISSIANAKLVQFPTYKDFSKEYSVTPAGAERIDLIDRALQTQLQNRTYSDADVLAIAKLREGECAKAMNRCLDISQWKARTCSPEGAPGPEMIAAWHSISANITLPAQVTRFLSELEKCSTSLSATQLVYAGDALSGMGKGSLSSLSVAVNSWMTDRIRKSQLSPAAKMDEVSAASNALASNKPPSIYGAAAVALASLPSLGSAQLDQIAATGSEAKDLFGQWIRSLQSAIFIGRNVELSDFVSANPKLWTQIPSMDTALVLAEFACVGWIETGRAKICDERLKSFEAKAATDTELALRLEVARGRYYFLTGQPEKAIALLNGTLPKTAGSPEFQAWVHFGLSQYYSAITHPGEVTKHLTAFKKSPSARNFGWLYVLSITRLETFELDQGRCKASIAAGNEALAFLRNQMQGEVGEHAWIHYFQTLCSIQLGDQASAKRSFAKLSEMLKAMPSLSYQKELAEAAFLASGGKPYQAAIDKVGARLGPKHPEIVRAKNLIAKIGKKA